MLKEILKDIRNGQNLDAYIAIIVSVILAVLSLKSMVTIEIVGAAVLASISWLTFQALAEKKKNDRQREELALQISRIIPVSSASTFFSENYVNNSKNLQDAFQNAQEIFIAGHAQTRMIIGYSSQITKVLERNGSVKFVLMDPLGKAIENIVQRSANPDPIEITRNTFKSGLARLDSIRKKISSGSKIKIKLIDFMLPFTIYGFDLNSPENARLFIWFTPFKETSDRRPGFMLTPKSDPVWYSHFKQQLETVWNWDEAKDY